MFLKRLEAFGFKSFADKTVFDFEPGFTCIVGPNGCGKSNVVDAVKWVLGDQSPKSLRGSEMLDIIFNGSAHRKPLNFAEITLTFDNHPNGDGGERRLPLEADEVSVTRRLYRSGDSEYLINKALCRLRDIRELFWDTGVGTTSYSIIEQGKVGQLLEANSKERRDLFEEAAGIHKYKERKKEALRRLDTVENNMARLNDMLQEIERQHRSVMRQAARARKAQEIGAVLRKTKLDILLHETWTYQTRLHEAEGALAGAQDQVARLSSELGEAQSATVAEQERMGELDAELTSVRAKLTEGKTGMAGLETEIEHDRRAVETMLQEAQTARAAAQEASQRAAALASEREKAELDLANNQQALEERRQAAADLTVLCERQRAEAEETVGRLEAARRAALDVLGRRTQHQQALTQAEADLGGLDYRIRKVRAEVTRAEDAMRFAQRESEDVQARMDQVRRRKLALETDQAGLHNLQARTEEELQRLQAAAQELRNQLEKHRSRLTVLEDLTESGEGLSQGVRAVLDESRSRDDEVLGIVAHLLRVRAEHEAGIEAALGSREEALVTSSFQAAQRCLQRLCESVQGRAVFLPLDRCAEEQAGGIRYGLDPAARQAPGCLGRAADLVGFDEHVRPAAEAVLGDVLVFETGEQALAAHRNDADGSRWRRVALDGALVEPRGAVGGGRHRQDRLGLIGRRNEIGRLAIAMSELEQRIEALAERSAFLEKRAQRLVRDDERMTSDLASLADTQTELKALLSAIAREESRSAEEKDVAAAEVRELDAERAALAERVKTLRAEKETLEAQEQAAGDEAARLGGELSQREAAAGESLQALEEAKLDSSTLAARVEGMERHTQSLSAQFSDRRDVADRETRRADHLDARRHSVETDLGEKDRRRAALAESIREMEAVSARLADEKENARLRFEDARGCERATSGQLEQARDRAREVEGEKLEISLRLDGKQQQALSEFKLDIRAELAQRGGPPEVPPEALEEARKLQERLERLGPVNMYALEEQTRLEERLAFLKTQHGDLESARACLRDVIARINRRSRKQFQDTFEAVRAQFTEIFRKLFGGGKADLVLEEGEDILDAGIEIVARPPGKEPRSIRQLSGGEKAMTTIALLFAVFRSRPAPFCILDEVDAPLDESNVDRFNHIVREFMDRSQFLVVSHNKRTMSHADILYGVTMPEPGVSKRIAIKFHEIEQHLPMEQIEKQADESRQRALKDAGAQADSEPAAPEPPASQEAESAAQQVASETTASSVGGGED